MRGPRLRLSNTRHRLRARHSLLPHPPHQENQPRDDAAGKKQQRVWTLANGEPRAIPVTIGAASGGMSEVTTGEVQPGTVLVIDIIGAAEQS